MKFIYVLCLIIVLLISGCKKTQEQLLKERVIVFQNYIMNKDFEKAYEMVSPQSRNTVQGNKKIFIDTRLQAYSDCSLESFKILKVNFLNKDKTSGLIEIEYVLDYIEKGKRTAVISQPWEFVNNLWYRK